MHQLSGWKSAACPVEVEYSPRVLEEIREKAVSGLVALRRTGLGVGGLLLGAVNGPVVSIVDLEEIECSHAMGPGFALSPAELDSLRARLQQKSPLAVVGMYLSKPRGDIDLTPQQLAMMQELFAEPTQVLMVIRPGSLEPSSVVFHYWTSNGLERGEEWDLLPWRPETPKASSAEPSAPISEIVAASEIAAVSNGFIPSPVEATQPSPEQAAWEPAAKDPAEAPAQDPAPPPPAFKPSPISVRMEARAADPGVPTTPDALLHPAERIFLGLKRNARKILTYSVAVLALLLISAAIYFSRPMWMTPPAANLTITDAAGVLTFHWNPKAAEFVDAGTLSVLDGGHRTTIALTHDELMKGSRDYFRASGIVTASLALDERRYLASFTEPERSLKAAPPAPGTAPPAPTARKISPARKPSSEPKNP